MPELKHSDHFRKLYTDAARLSWEKTENNRCADPYCYICGYLDIDHTARGYTAALEYAYNVLCERLDTYTKEK